MSMSVSELEGPTRTSRFPTPISNSPPTPRPLKRTRDSDSPVPIFRLESSTPTPPSLPPSYQMSITNICITVLDTFVTFGANLRAAIVRHLAPPVPEQSLTTITQDASENESDFGSEGTQRIHEEARLQNDAPELSVNTAREPSRVEVQTESEPARVEVQRPSSKSARDVSLSPPAERLQFFTAPAQTKTFKRTNSHHVYQSILAKRDSTVSYTRPVKRTTPSGPPESSTSSNLVLTGRVGKKPSGHTSRNSPSVKAQSQANHRRKPLHDSPARPKVFREPETHTLEGLINSLVQKQEDGFNSYAKVQEERAKRQAEIDKLRAARDQPQDPIVLPLTPETAAEVNRILQDRNTTKVLIDKYRQQITVRDVQTLRPGVWLNDEVINFYLNLVVDRGNANSKHPKVFAFNSFFYHNLCKTGYSAVSRWARRGKIDGDNMLRLDYLIVPVHLSNHWTLGVVNFVKKRLEYYDSLGGRGRDFFDHMRKYLEAETKGKLDLKEWVNYRMQNAPVQKNGYDCGVFLCKTAEIVCKSQEPLFTQEDIGELRSRMVAEIVKGKLGVA